jgi:hypothetical protein
MKIKDAQDESPILKSPSSSSVSTGKHTGRKPLQYEWLEYPEATTSDKNEREKEKELEREKEKDKEKEKEIQISEKTIDSIPAKKKKLKQVKRSSITLAEWGSGPAPGYLQERCSSREGRRAGTAPERVRQVGIERERDEERERLQRIERERVQAEIEEAEILAVITGRTCSSAPLDTRQHTHRLPSDLNRASPFTRTYESTCTYDETDISNDGWTSLDYESSGKQMQCRNRDRDSAPREQNFLSRTYELAERGSAERKSRDGRKIAFTPQSTESYMGKDLDGESEGDRDRVSEGSCDIVHGILPPCIPFPLTPVGHSSPPTKIKNNEISSGFGSGSGSGTASGSLSRSLLHKGDRDRDRDLSFETSDGGVKRSAPVAVPVSVSVHGILRRDEEDTDSDCLNLSTNLNKCVINRQPSHSEDIVFINKRNGSGKYSSSKSQIVLVPDEAVSNLNRSTGISGREMFIPSKLLSSTIR